jgi:ABC-type transport system involved in cytochrome bd biosynthesis fused ATPase/permease subunit
MSTPAFEPEERSLGQLVSDLSEQASKLFRAEIELAKAEVTAKAQLMGMGAGMLTAAGVLALYVLAAAITTAILALSVVWAPWLAALVVTAFLLLVTVILALLGRRTIKKASPPGQIRAKETVQDDIAAVKAGLKP